MKRRVVIEPIKNDLNRLVYGVYVLNEDSEYELHGQHANIFDAAEEANSL